MPREIDGYRDTLALLRELFPGRAALTRAEAARALGCSERTLQRKKEIPSVAIGQTVRYPLDSLARWLAKTAAGR